MGNFYTNIVVKGPTQEDVAEQLAKAGNSAYVTPSEGECVVVFDASCESQHPGVISSLCGEMSSSFGCPALAILNHDDDVLACWLFVSGDLVDEYNSCPGALDGGSDIPEGGDAAALCRAFGSLDEVNSVEEVLRAPSGGPPGYTFALQRHAALAELLGLPTCSVGYGYLAIEMGDYPEGLDEDDFIEAA